MALSVKKLYDEGKKCYEAGRMDEAKRQLSLFVKTGRELLDKAMDKWYESRQIRDAKFLLEEAERWFAEGELWFGNEAAWVSAVRAKDGGDRAAERLGWKFAEGWYYWGFSLASLARIESEGSDLDRTQKLFNQASDKYDKAIKLGWYDAGRAQVYKGANYFRLSLLNTGIGKQEAAELKRRYEKEATACFVSSGRSILEIFVALDHDAEQDLIEGDLIYDMLDIGDSYDGAFFGAVVNVPGEELRAYKEAYIRSLCIIRKLYVDSVVENEVASYREMSAARKLLRGDAKFRLTAVDYSNDPKEGEVLLDYLFGENDTGLECVEVEDYGVFAGCFTFSWDNLNMFRLYGKGTGGEGTGLSLVFKPDFFSKRYMLATDLDGDRREEEKLALFRCIYFNAKEGRVESVGRRDGELFLDKEKNDRVHYDAVIGKCIEDVNKKIKELKDHIKGKNLKKDLIGRLLINLRYLIKSSCFKEEQECRIVQICHLDTDKEERIALDDDCNLCVYYEPTVSKYVKEIHFGPKAVEIDRFKDFLRYKGLSFMCTKSKWKLA
jgi:hypothetical protein